MSTQHILFHLLYLSFSRSNAWLGTHVINRSHAARPIFCDCVVIYHRKSLSIIIAGDAINQFTGPLSAWLSRESRSMRENADSGSASSLLGVSNSCTLPSSRIKMKSEKNGRNERIEPAGKQRGRWEITLEIWKKKKNTIKYNTNTKKKKKKNLPESKIVSRRWALQTQREEYMWV